MATIKDVAELAEVSQATVSNVFNGTVRVREKTRRKVLAAAKTLHYVPNVVASSLRSQKTSLVALGVADIANPSHSVMVRGAIDVFLGNEFHPLIFCSDENSEQEKEIINIVCQQRVAGLLLAPTTQEIYPAYKQLDDLHIKLVCVDRRVPDLDVDTVRSNDVSGFQKATEYLLNQGHERLAIVIGAEQSGVSLERLHGFEEAFSNRGLPVNPNLIIKGEYNESFGYQALSHLIQLEQPPTAIVATSTRVTLGILYAMRDHGFDNFKHLAIVGSASRSIEWLSMLETQLTIVAQPSYEIGQKAAALLVERLAGTRTGSGEEFLIEPELIIKK